MPKPGGFRPWREAWTDALYGEQGFYRRGKGPRGHFETSANAPGGEVALLAEALVRLAARHRCRRIVDVGAGRGELVAAMAAVAATGPVVEVTGVDVVSRPAGLTHDVGWLESPGGAALPTALTALEDALVVAHEWLDVVPCDVVAVDDHGGLRIVEVDDGGAERLGPPAAAELLAWCERWWPLTDGQPGARAEVGLTRDDAWAGLLTRVRSGVAVSVDYGHTAADRPPGGTLAGHRLGRLVPPAPDGSCDITAHVAWDSLLARSAAVEPRLMTQREALTGLGLDGRRPATDPAEPSYLTELRRAAAAATLLDGSGLGGLGWLTCPLPAPGGATAAIGQAQAPPARLAP